MYAPWTEGVTLTEACERCGLDEAGRELVSHVRAGRLILYGRVATSEQRSVLYGQIELVDPGNSSAIFKGERYSDVVAVPALRSVCRVDLVAGRSLSEVFKEYIIGDPEVISLSLEAMRVKPVLKNVFVDGRHTPFGVREWPADLDYSVLGGLERIEAIGFLADPEPEAVIDAMDALQDRYGALLKMLRQDEIEAYGLANRAGDPHVLMRSIWAHKDFEIDPIEGDVYSNNPECEDPRYDRLVKRWTGVIFRPTGRGLFSAVATAPASIAQHAFHVNSTDDVGLRPKRTKPRGGRVASSRPTAHQESIAAAIAALWSDGVPKALTVQRRDQMIIEWQRKQPGQLVVSDRSIGRFFKRFNGLSQTVV
jgi:hypothetical protein